MPLLYRREHGVRIEILRERLKKETKKDSRKYLRKKLRKTQERRKKMAKKTMADLQKFLKEREENKGGSRINYDSDIYPFWNMKVGETATVRILPDTDDENPFPFVEKLEHKLMIDGKLKNIPCPKMHGDACPICELSQEYYNADDEENGKHYYRNRMHLCKAVVISDPLPENDDGENFEGKVVTLQLGFQIMEKIIEQLGTFFDEDEDALPWDLLEGYNFKIKKTSQGKGHPKYDIGSTFERNPSPLPKAILKELELVDLQTLLPEVASYDKINELLEAHLSGGSADDDSLESKKKKSSQDGGRKSASRSALERLSGADSDDDDDDDVSSQTESEEEEDDEDDDDDLRELVAQIKRSKGK